MRSRINGERCLTWLVGMIIVIALPACNETDGTNPLSINAASTEKSYVESAGTEFGDELAGPRRPGRGGFDPLAQAEDLGLTDAQIAEIDALREELRTAMQALHEQFRNGEIDREAVRTAADALHEAQRASIETILTEEQLAQLEAMRSEQALEHFAERLDRIGDRDLDERVSRMTEQLGLDDAQVTALTQIFEAAATSETAILEAAVAGESSVDATREALDNLREATRSSIEEILTEEQLQMLEQMGPPEGQRPGGPGESRGPNGQGRRGPGPRGAGF